MLSQRASRRGFVPAFGIATALVALVNIPAVAPAPPPKHGLTGSYYISTLETHSDVNPTGRDWFVQFWMDPNDFQLPRPFTAPAAVRVDPQIAFGQGKGFVSQNGKQTQWWPTGFAVPAGWTIWQATMKPWDWVTAVIWKGYLHLPQAGTYYLATASRGSSAVYLNQARVALNGTSAGVLFSDVFTYAKEDLRDYLQNLAYGREDLLSHPQPGESYVVPVTVETPRDVPIEVRYNGWRSESSGRGIDLFWVTPDSPRDSSGKPVAHIVPSDVLYTEPPGPIEQPAVRGANSMLSADFLYFPSIRTDKDVTVTVRLADKDGNPVAGKRVRIGSLVSYGAADLIRQPERPTDEKGETTARIRPGEGYKVTHDSRIFATDVTDLVDVAQVTQVTFQAGTVPTSFFATDAFSPYYAPEVLKVEPLPLMVGRPVTVSVALENRGKFPVELAATFRANDWAIGPATTNEIGRVEHIHLKAGEPRRASINWTPGKAESHQCFEVRLQGSVLFGANRSRTGILAAAFLPRTNLAYASPPAANSIWERIQSNIGPVVPCAPVNPADPTIYGLPGVNVVFSRYGNFRAYPIGGEPHTVDPTTYEYDDEKDSKLPHAHPGMDVSSHDARDSITSLKPLKWKHDAAKLPFTSPIAGKVKCETPKGSDKCEGSDYNVVGVVSCDGNYTVQFLHASRVDVKNGQPVSRGQQLGVTGGFAPDEHGNGKQDQVGVHLHVQMRKNDKHGEPDSYVDPLYEGPLVDPPSCDPSPCPKVVGPPHQNQGTISSPPRGTPLSGPVKKRATDFGKHLETESERRKDEWFDIWESTGDSLAVKRFKHSDRMAKAGAKAAKDPPDPAYQRLAVAASDSVVGYMDALTASMERYSGAEAAGDRPWTARHFTAMQLYLRRVAEALRRDADAAQKEGEQLPPDAATQARLEAERQQVRERLRRTRLTTEDFKALRAAGVPEGTARATMYRVLNYPQQSLAGKLMDPEEGYIDVNPLPVRSMRAMLLHSATEQRRLADEAEEIALPSNDTAGGASTRGFLQTFIVGNPHDREETIDLAIRPISLPPVWKLSIANAKQEGQDTASGDPQFAVREIEPGKRYSVTLPAKLETKVATVVVPVGEVGANTTARWAVEGKIGDELIGGMVHEMNVPYTIADLKIPPVGSKEVEEELPTSSKAWARTVAEVAAGILVTGMLVFAFILWHRRLAKVAP